MKVKNTIVIVILLIFSSSCAQVLFMQPQPQKGTVVKSFLDNLQGVYADSTLEIVIGKKKLIVSDEEYLMTSKDPGENEVLVKFYNNFYFASFLDSAYYSVYMAKFYDNKLALYMVNADAITLAKMNKMMKVDTLDLENEQYLINPSKKQFNRLLEYEMFDVVNVLEKLD